MPSDFIRYVDSTDGVDSGANDGLTNATAWKTLQYAEDTLESVVVGLDSVTLIVLNGDDVGTEQKITFNSANWAGVNVLIRPGAGEPRISAVSTDAFITIFTAADGVPNLRIQDVDANSLAGGQPFIFCIQTPTVPVAANWVIDNCTVTWTAANVANRITQYPTIDCTGCLLEIYGSAFTRFNTIMFGQTSIGTLIANNNDFNLVDWNGPGAALQPNNVSAGEIRDITLRQNKWHGIVNSNFSLLKVEPIIPLGGVTWTITDEFDFADSLESAGLALFDIDDTATDGGEFTVDITRAKIITNSTAAIIRMGTSVNPGYTNSQLPRAKTATDDTFQKLRFVAINTYMQALGTGADSGVVALRCGVIHCHLEDTTLLATDTDAHAINIVCNDAVLIRCHMEARELPCLLYGDRITIDSCYVAGNRPCIMGKTGGGQDEAAQGHTITNNTFFTPSANPILAAFDDYDWQGDQPYGTTWYGSEESGGDGSACGYQNMTITGNTFVAPNGARALHMGRLLSTGTAWESDYFDSWEDYETYLAGESGDGRTNTLGPNYSTGGTSGGTVPAATDVRFGVAVGAGTGTAYIPAATDVRSGVSVDATVGTCGVPLPEEVLIGVAVDNTTGTVTLPVASNVVLGVSYGPSLSTTGTVRVPGASDVRDSVSFGDNDTVSGLLDLPSINDVQNGVVFDQTTKTGNFEWPIESEVLTGIGYGSLGTEYTGTLDVTGDPPVFPSVSDVRLGVTYGTSSSPTQFTGNVRVPTADRVEQGYQYDTSDTVTGTLVSDLLDPSNVREGIDRGDGVLGILVSPAQADVDSGVLYGANSEYVGTFTCGTSDPGDVEWIAG